MGIRKRGKTFQVYVYDPQTQRQVTATVSTKRQAEKKEIELKESLIKKTASVHHKTDVPKREVTNGKYIISNVLTAYFKTLDLCKITLEIKVRFFRAFFANYQDYTIQDIADNIKAIIAEYMSKRNITPITKNTRISHVRAFLNWCEENNFISSAPKIQRVKNARCKHFIPPTQEELAKILSVCTQEHHIRSIIICSQLGVRVGESELFKIKWSDVDWSRHVLRLKAAVKNPNEPMREIPLSDIIFKLFSQWYSADKKKGIEYVISYRGKPITTFLLSWRILLTRAGITRRIRPYDLRHAFATEAIAAGADPGTVAKLMGHVDTTMVFKHYQHVMDKQKQAVMDTLSHSELCQSLTQNLQ